MNGFELTRFLILLSVCLSLVCIIGLPRQPVFAQAQCKDIIIDFEFADNTFDGLKHGAKLKAINEKLALFGIKASAKANEGRAGFDTIIVFDSFKNKTPDPDLEVDIGNLAIIPRNVKDKNGDHLVDKPDDWEEGGTMIFEFDNPRLVKSFVFVDADRSAVVGHAKAFDISGKIIGDAVDIPKKGDGSVQTINVDAAGAVRLEISFVDSGAVTNIELVCQERVVQNDESLMMDDFLKTNLVESNKFVRKINSSIQFSDKIDTSIQPKKQLKAELVEFFEFRDEKFSIADGKRHFEEAFSEFLTFEPVFASGAGKGQFKRMLVETLSLAALADTSGFDLDSDGIADNIDVQPNNFSDEFSDVSLGGTTTGTIITRGEQILSVVERPNPSGIHIIADAGGGTIPAKVSICSGSANVFLDAGDQIIVTCSSVIFEVISGSLDIELVGDDGRTGTATLQGGDKIVFDPATFTVTNEGANTVTVFVGAKSFEVLPSQTTTIPDEEPEAQEPTVSSETPQFVKSSSGGGGRIGVGSGGGGGGGSPGRSPSLGGFGGIINPFKIYEISYDVCDANIAQVIVGVRDNGTLPHVKIRSSFAGVNPAILTDEQPFVEYNRDNVGYDLYLYEAKIGILEPGVDFFIVIVESIMQRDVIQLKEIVNVESCKGKLVLSEITPPSIEAGGVIKDSLPQTSLGQEMKTFQGFYKGDDFEFSYHNDGGVVTDINVDEKSNSIELYLKDVKDNLVLTLPRSLIDEPEDQYVFLTTPPNGKDISYEILESTNDAVTIQVRLPKDTIALTIFGAKVIPEFGFIATLTLAVLLLIVVVTSKNIQIKYDKDFIRN